MNQKRQRLLGGIQAALMLEHTPVGLAFVEEPPPGVDRPERPAPSGCSFWRMGEREVVYTTPEDHNCPIGVMTMGFQLAKEQEPEAKALLDLMCDCQYISPDELSQIPSVKKGHQGIVYGPLGQMPVEPDVALFICRPGQAMLLAEASGGLAWKGSVGTSAFGRPACAVIPVAINSGASSVSVGCIGARTYASLTDEEMLVAVPGAALTGLAARLSIIVAANATMERVHVERRAQF